MAGLANTLTQSLRASYPSNLDKYEDRLSRYGAWELAKEDTNDINSIVTPEVIELAKQSIGNTLSIPVIDGADVTIGSTRSCTIADTENVSNLVNVSFTTYSFGFNMIPAQYQNNDIKYQADFNRKLVKYLKKFASTLDTAVVSAIETAKSTKWNSAFVGAGAKYGALVGDAVQVANADKNLIFNDMSTMMDEDDFEGIYNVLGSTTLKSTVMQYTNQGANNDTNTAFQFGDYDFKYSNRVVNGSGVESTFYAMPKGTIATFNRNEPDALLGSRVSESEYWETVVVPIVELEMGVKYKKECADNSGINGGSGAGHLTASMKESFIWSTDVAIITAYNSDSVNVPSPIHKGEITVA